MRSYSKPFSAVRVMLFVFAAILALFAAGCGKDDHHVNNVPTAQLKFVFTLAQAKSEVPVTVDSYEFIGYNSQDVVAYPSFKVAKNKVVTEGQNQVVVLDNVPLTCTKMVINYLAADGKVVAQSIKADLVLTQGPPQEIIVGEAVPIVEAALTVKFSLGLIPTDITSYQVMAYDNQGNTIAQSAMLPIAELKDYTFPEVPLNCTYIEVYYYNADGDEYGVSSIAEVPAMQAGSQVTVTAEGIVKTLVEADLSISGIWESAPATATCRVNYLLDDMIPRQVTIENVAIASGKADVSFDEHGKSLSIICLTFLDEKNCAFEWFDRSIPVDVNIDGTATVIDIAANKFAGGDGTEAKPYEVANPRQLSMVGADESTAKAHYVQTNDINFAGSCGLSATIDNESHDLVFANENTAARFFREGQGWNPLGVSLISDNGTTMVGQEFSGVYDGGKYVIDGLFVNKTDNIASYEQMSQDGSYAGLFGLVRGAKLMNISIGVNSAVRNQCNALATAGAVCGRSNNNNIDSDRTYITGCSNSAPVVAVTTEYGADAGGVNGLTFRSSITDCSNTAAVTAIYDGQTNMANAKRAVTTAGGVSGYVDDNKVNFAEESGTKTKLVCASNLTNSGDILTISKQKTGMTTAPMPCAGGVAGLFYDAAMEKCTNSGNVCVENNIVNTRIDVNAGGIVSSSWVVDDINKYSITAGHSITECVNSGDVDTLSAGGNLMAGGISGESSHFDFSKCVNKGEVLNTDTNAASSSFTGGITASQYDKGNFTCCNNEGFISSSTVTKAGDCGGILGSFARYNDTTATLVTVERCANSGAVFANSSGTDLTHHVGGILGCFEHKYKSLDVLNSFNYGAIDSTSLTNAKIGGIVGDVTAVNVVFTNTYSGDGSVKYGSSKQGICGSLAVSDYSVTNCFCNQAVPDGTLSDVVLLSEDQLLNKKAASGDNLLWQVLDSAEPHGVWKMNTSYSNIPVGASLLTWMEEFK